MLSQIKKLSTNAKLLLALRLREQLEAKQADSSKTSDAGRKRLVAYVVADTSDTNSPNRSHASSRQDKENNSGQNIESQSFRDQISRKITRRLSSELPTYMIPSSIVVLPSLPRNSNGKVDRDRLSLIASNQQVQSAQSYEQPRNELEQKLVTIWTKVLGAKNIGIHDNFFEIGGDSILGIQIISKANQAGLAIRPGQLFQYQTIAELAATVETATTTIDEQESICGTVPFTPIQHWFFELDNPHLNYWNQSTLFRIPKDIDISVLETAFKYILQHHDALRLRFKNGQSGWQQFNSRKSNEFRLLQNVVSEESFVYQGNDIKNRTVEIQSNLDLENDDLIRAEVFESRDGDKKLLFIAIHHLAVDGVSWGILLEDLETVYRQMAKGDSISLPAKTTSFKTWAERLCLHAQSSVVKDEVRYWLRQEDTNVTFDLPLDFPDISGNTEESAQTVSVTLSGSETQFILYEISSIYNTRINEILLTALFQVIANWTRSDFVYFGLEGHGREQLFDDIDISRTVGWFTSFFPVGLRADHSAGPGILIKSIKEQLRQIPSQGIGFGLLRYLCYDSILSKKIRSLPDTQLLFNYLGQYDKVISNSSMFQYSELEIGPSRSPMYHRSHLIEVNAFVSQGQLKLDWIYSSNIHLQSTVAKIASGYVDALRAIISHCKSSNAGGFTPADFPEAGLDQDELDSFIDKITE